MTDPSFLWVEQYRPKIIDDCILPQKLKNTFKELVKKGEIPNLLLSGPPGIGKTTIAKALCREMGAQVFVINGSDEGRFLDTIRNQAKSFASTVAFGAASKHKVIIVDEADNTTHDVQLLLRANIETFYKNCRFIFTCNYKNKIIEPLQSRCSTIDFAIKGNDKAKMAGQFFKRVKGILDENLITYEADVVGSLIAKYFPDWRRVLNELQRQSVGGSITSDILIDDQSSGVSTLVPFLKNREFMNVRKWVVYNCDNDPVALLRSIYDVCYDQMLPSSIPQAVLTIARYSYQSAFVADQEINLLACLTEIMTECEFK